MYSVLPSSAPTPILNLAPALVFALPNGVSAGFPSPAEDLGAKRIDLNEILIKHPLATYTLRVSGQSMRDAGIDDGDVVLVDRAVKAAHGHIVVAVVDGEFTIKRLFQRHGRIKLQAANPTYPDIVPGDGQTIEIWGVVRHCIKPMPV
ncbi:LexA family protein [Roseateles violae]|uniref:Translesion error-prone DNA polymerase V autoproteolytic subunit n=1 Tax=Roseateles violae TaxID=3058042 RepID=A0ABT8DN50_9BURK|nr:translesion error-prone DNA polymerase V autoproteolytic subunit [Pelomonas sp. PFR6]MDN3919368.1 translesion error-prone DNA polymerase V autoproteolytic subunit [Pelomonas sp. PFR6]